MTGMVKALNGGDGDGGGSGSGSGGNGGGAGAGGRRRRPPNDRLAALLAEAGCTGAELARSVNALGTLQGLALRYDRTAVAHWLSGTRPRPPVPTLIAAALTDRCGRLVTLEEAGLAEPAPAGGRGAGPGAVPAGGSAAGRADGAAPGSPAVAAFPGAHSDSHSEGLRRLAVQTLADTDPRTRPGLLRNPYQPGPVEAWRPAPAPPGPGPLPGTSVAQLAARRQLAGHAEQLRALVHSFAGLYLTHGGVHTRAALAAWLAQDAGAFAARFVLAPADRAPRGGGAFPAGSAARGRGGPVLPADAAAGPGGPVAPGARGGAAAARDAARGLGGTVPPAGSATGPGGPVAPGARGGPAAGTDAVRGRGGPVPPAGSAVRPGGPVAPGARGGAAATAARDAARGLAGPVPPTGSDAHGAGGGHGAGPGGLAGAVGSAAQWSDAREVLCCYAQLAHLLADMTADAGHHGLAQEYHVISLGLARQAGDRRMYAITLRAMSAHAGRLGQPAHAVRLALLAVDTAPGDGDPAVRAYLLAQRAAARAHAGERAAALADLAAADELLTPAPQDPGPFDSYGRADLAFARARTHLALGEYSAAADALEQSLRARPPGHHRPTALTHALLAETVLRLGHLTGACEHWQAFLTALPAVHSRAAREALGRLLRDLTPYRHVREAVPTLAMARAFAERL
ncbi:hypothetical protein OG625_20040 [Streptomyces sp. NBC_01351]|uniref:hypothetical protein n=1 Tax=Streptomyces sp. NBC_01351 TaxID=2903833 RepID=UPI002E2F9D02|nr:hypothetical protein [Streptomyces sp. NBC_01351]